MKKGPIIATLIGILIISLSWVFLKDQPSVRNLIIILVVLFTLVPFVIQYNRKLNIQKEKEQKFLEFIRDIVENVRSGTPISKSIINLHNRDYGALGVHIQKLANQVFLGIPLTKCFETFAEETQSPVIARSVNLISEASRSGGEINTILSSVASSVNQTEVIQKERRAAIANLIVQGYIIFFVFILIILVLQFFLMPLVKNMGPVQDLNIDTKEQVDLTSANFFLLIVQSFFSGLVIGKISEGKISAGIKHSFILVSLALVLSGIAEVIFR